MRNVVAGRSRGSGVRDEGGGPDHFSAPVDRIGTIFFLVGKSGTTNLGICPYPYLSLFNALRDGAHLPGLGWTPRLGHNQGFQLGRWTGSDEINTKAVFRFLRVKNLKWNFLFRITK